MKDADWRLLITNYATVLKIAPNI